LTFINLILINVSERSRRDLTKPGINLSYISDSCNINLLMRLFILVTSKNLLFKMITLILLLIFLLLYQRLSIWILRSGFERLGFIIINTQVSCMNVFYIWSVRWFLINMIVALINILQGKYWNLFSIIHILKMGLNWQFL